MPFFPCYQPEKSEKCEDCQAGYYCDSPTTSRKDMEKKECPAGLFCNTTQAQMPDLTQNACKTGHYCERAVSFSVRPTSPKTPVKRDTTARER